MTSHIDHQLQHSPQSWFPLILCRSQRTPCRGWQRRRLIKFRANAVLLAAITSASAWGQDVNVYGTTLFQLWKQDTPGFNTSTFDPATQFLGVDVTNLGTDTLSLHLYGWGRTDLADQSRTEKKSGGELTYGYLKYRAPEGNLEAQAGRFAVNQGVAIEQVDGASMRADLIGGFTLSAFGGVPVSYRTIDPVSQREYDYQRDVIFGGRLAKRFSRLGEVGISYVQDGSTSARFLNGDNLNDYTRRQLAGDIHFTPNSVIDLSGRTVVDVAPRLDAPPGAESDTSRIAEHNYNLGVRFSSLFSLNGTYTQRNFQAYYTGTNLPSLFNPYELGCFRSQGLSATIGSATSWEAVIDCKKTNRDSYGRATRFGGELRRHATETGFRYGFGFHRVNADDVPITGVLITSYGLSYCEIRAWVMYEKDRLSAALDGIHQNFDDKNNPNLNGKASVYEVVGSVGFQVAPNIKISGDLSYGVTPLLQQETIALLRADYRFGMASRGGKK